MSNQEVTTTINHELCTGCGMCIQVCPSNTISMINGKAAVTGSHSMNCGHCESTCPTGAIKVGALKEEFSYRSFRPEDRWLPHGTFEPAQLDRLLRSRRSCRNYTNKQVPLEILYDLINFGITAPSGTNSQQWTFTLVPTREKLIVLGGQVADFFHKLNQKAANPVLRAISKIFYKDRLGKYHQNHYTSVQHGLKDWYIHKKDTLFHGATAAIIIGSKPGASCPQDDALMASQNILLGAHALGLGSCMIGYAVHAANLSATIKPALTIPAEETVYACIALGYPREEYSRLTHRKKPVIRIV
nr:nitroreductase family protein [Desulfobulbaceae bacterium]